MSPTPEAERAASPSRWRKFWPWFNVGLTAVLLIGGVWYLSRTLNFSDVQQAIAAADGRFIGLAFLVFMQRFPMPAQSRPLKIWVAPMALL